MHRISNEELTKLKVQTNHPLILVLQRRESATKVADEVSGDQDVPGEAPPAGPHQPGGLAEPAVQGTGGPRNGLCWDPLPCLQEAAPTIGETAALNVY